MSVMFFRCRRPLLVFLGAGASAPHLSDTQAVTGFLRQWRDFLEPQTPTSGPFMDLDHFWARPGIGTSAARRPFFEYLHQIVSRRWASPGNLNFEDLIHTAEVLNSLVPLPPHPPQAHDDFRPVAGAFLQLEPTSGLPNFSNVLGLIACEACYAILNYFADACDVAEPQIGRIPLPTALAKLSNHFLLKGYSINYDDMPFWTNGLSWATGFSGDPETGQAFNPKLVHRSDAKNYLYQLHGSVLWGEDHSGESRVVRFNSRSLARAKRTSRSSGPHYHDRSTGCSAPMITGLRKADKTLLDPFDTFLWAMRRDAASIPRWLIIGYGAGDFHINQILARGRTQHGSEFRCAIISFDKHFNSEDELQPWLGHPGWEALLRVCRYLEGDLRTYQNTMFRRVSEGTGWRNNFRRLNGTGVGITFDGTDVAMVSHLPTIIDFLNE